MHTALSRIAVLALATLLCALAAGAGTLSVTDYGAKPDSRRDCTAAVAAAVEALRGQPGATLSFPKGRYDFYATKGTLVGLGLTGLTDATIEGNGSTLVFHGKCKIAAIKDCSNLTLRNFSADWEHPFTIQATVREAASDHLDLWLDSALYSYKVEQGLFYVLGDGWQLRPIADNSNLYDPKTGEIIYNTWDAPLGNIFCQKAIDMGNGIVRFMGNLPSKPQRGTIASIHTGRYTGLEGISINDSRDITLKNVSIFYAMNIGIRAQHSENITLDNACATANKEKQRVFSTVADNAHFNCCRGLITVKNCNPTGMGDDFLNVHGRNYPILKLYDPMTAEVKIQDAVLKEDEEVWFLDKHSKQRTSKGTIKQIKGWSNNNGKYLSYTVAFTSPLPQGIGEGCMIESAKWVPDVVVENCSIGRTNRARGILVTTPGKVVIQNNRFATAGAAILIEGDDNKWFESGACRDVTIRNNMFDCCLTSGSKHGKPIGWGTAVITISPNHFPQEGQKPYHSNINIVGNRFNMFDAPLLFARSVDGITFAGNTIMHTSRYQPYALQRQAIVLNGCKNANIGTNSWDRKHTSRSVLTTNMPRKELKLRDTKLININRKANGE